MTPNSIYNVRKIYLMLGSACNFNCVYCVQHTDKPRTKKVLKPELLAWLDDLAYRLPLKFKPTIMFYGGEPLLYKESIKAVIDHCGDNFNYCIVSNGAYLTDEDVEYYNENDVEFALSNDGRNTDKTRQVDMLQDEEFVARFKRIKRKEVAGVVSGYNQDFHDFIEYVHEKVPDVSVSYEELMTNDHMDDSVYTFDKDVLLNDYKRMGDELSVAYAGGEETMTSAIFNKFIRQALRRLSNPQFPQYGVCGAGRSSLSLDLQGNVYLCKDFNVKIGTIADDYETLTERAKVKTKELRDAHLEAKGCFECPAFYFCRGGCPFEKPSVAQKGKCEMVRTKWASVVSFLDNRVKLEVKR